MVECGGEGWDPALGGKGVLVVYLCFCMCMWGGGGFRIYLCWPTRDSLALRDWVNAGTASRVEAERAGSARRVRLVVMSYSPHWRWPPGSLGRRRC